MEPEQELRSESRFVGLNPYECWGPDEVNRTETIRIIDMNTVWTEGAGTTHVDFVICTILQLFPPTVHSVFNDLLIVCSSDLGSQYNDYAKTIHIAADTWTESRGQQITAIFHECLHRAHAVLDPVSYNQRCGNTQGLLRSGGGVPWTDNEELLTISGTGGDANLPALRNLLPARYNENVLRLSLGLPLRRHHDDKTGQVPHQFAKGLANKFGIRPALTILSYLG